MATKPLRVGDRVRALVYCENDLTDDGLGVEICARPGDVLIVRRPSNVRGRWAVSHEDVTDGRAFLVDPHEVELIDAAGVREGDRVMERTRLNAAVRTICAEHYTAHTGFGCARCPIREACHSSPTVLSEERMEEWRSRVNAAAEVRQRASEGSKP